MSLATYPFFGKVAELVGRLSAIQGEIDQLGQRQAALEEAQIVAMEALDSAREEVERLSQEESEWIKRRSGKYLGFIF